MKRIFSIVLLVCSILYSYELKAQFNTAMTINGSTANINFATCASIQPLDMFFSSNASSEIYNENTDFYKNRYYIELIRNGSVVGTKEFKTGDDEIACNPISCQPISFTFDDVPPLSGTYYCSMVVKKYAGPIPITTLYTVTSNPITITRPDDNSYAVCQGTDGDYGSALCGNTTFMVQAGTEHYVIQKESGLIYKFSSLGSTGDNMFAIVNTAVPSNLPGYNYLVGSQNFDTPITDLVYTSDNKTIISFEDGKMLKINGTGGSGGNMFQVTEEENGFTTISPSTYYAGSFKCLSKINDMLFKDNQLVISCENGNMLKINGSGGTGGNMFVVTENAATGFTNIFNWMPYFAGSAHFNSAVREVYPVGSHSFIATVNGKLLKINNLGGTGTNMFAITETTAGYTNNTGGTSYVGYIVFQTPVAKLYSNTTFTFICLESAKILKINGVGGTGANMFAVTETPTSFTNVAGYSYYSGTMKYFTKVVTMTHNTAGTALFIGFANGKMMKVQNSGGTGYDMFNTTENSYGFARTSMAYANHLLGSSFFRGVTTDIKFFGTLQILCLSTGKMLKVQGDGGTGTNMYAVAQQPAGFRPLLGYTQHLIGSQMLQCLYAAKTDGESQQQAEAEQVPEGQIDLKLFPNPFSSTLSVELPEELRNENTVIEIFAVNGTLAGKFTGREAGKMNTESLMPGMYIINVRSDNSIIQSIKAIKN